LGSIVICWWANRWDGQCTTKESVHACWPSITHWGHPKSQCLYCLCNPNLIMHYKTNICWVYYALTYL
jgi:hypothetical protein